MYGEIADAIAQRILSGALRPADRLPSERDLSQEFRVSRPTIREAMIALEVRGLVRTAERSGVFVTEPSTWISSPDRTGYRRAAFAASAAEIVEAMATLFSQVAALAARSVAAEEADSVPLESAADGDSLEYFLWVARIPGNLAVSNTVAALIHAARDAGLGGGAQAHGRSALTRVRPALTAAIRAGDAETAQALTRSAMAGLFAELIDAPQETPVAPEPRLSEQRRKLASRHPLAFQA